MYHQHEEDEEEKSLTPSSCSGEETISDISDDEEGQVPKASVAATAAAAAAAAVVVVAPLPPPSSGNKKIPDKKCAHCKHVLLPKKLPCGHRLHATCYEHLLADHPVNPRCPICNADIKKTRATTTTTSKRPAATATASDAVDERVWHKVSDEEMERFRKDPMSMMTQAPLRLTYHLASGKDEIRQCVMKQIKTIQMPEDMKKPAYQTPLLHVIPEKGNLTRKIWVAALLAVETV